MPDQERLRRTRAVVVVHHGQVVAERYAPGFTADTASPGWSMTKTTAERDLGCLLQTGVLLSSSYGASRRMAVRQATARAHGVAQLLRMTGPGIGFRRAVQQPAAPTWWSCLLGRATRPASHAQGTRRRADVALLQRHRPTRSQACCAGHSRTEICQAWPLTPRLLDARAASRGSGTGRLRSVLAMFMHATARRVAALGQFLLQDGVWQRQRAAAGFGP